jgi:hypothetical protein
MANNFHLMVSNSLFFACDAAGWFWSVERKCEYTNSEYEGIQKNPQNKKFITTPYSEVLLVMRNNVNQIAEIGDQYFDLICLLVNGGFNGFEERKNNFKALKTTLKNIYTCTD